MTDKNQDKDKQRKSPVKNKTERFGKAKLLQELRKVLAATSLAETLKPEGVSFILNLIFHTIKCKVTEGKSVIIPGFGKFFRTRHKGRGKTKLGGIEIVVPPHNVIRFRAADQMRALANGHIIQKPLPIPESLAIFAIPKKRAPKKPGRKALSRSALLNKVASMRRKMEALSKQVNDINIPEEPKDD